MCNVMEFVRTSDSTVFIFLESTTKLLESFEKKKRKTDAIWHINGSKCTTEYGVYKEFGSKLFFPDYFERNWDAFEDCMSDLQFSCCSQCNNHFFIIDNAISLLKLDVIQRNVFFEILSELEELWNQNRGRKRGVYKIILCCSNGQKLQVVNMVKQAKIEASLIYANSE